MAVPLLILSEGLILALVALAVKTQLALLRGFDLSVAAGILAAAETAVVVSWRFPSQTVIQPVVAGLASAAVGGVIMSLWNRILAGRLGRLSSPGTFLFVFSLGVSSAVSGLVGFLRGPGLRQAPLCAWSLETPWFVLAGAPLLALGGGLPLIGALLLLLNRRLGRAIDLLAQDRNFAVEIGIEPERLGIAGGLTAGLACGFVGWYIALSTGSTPEIGFQVFLLGAGGALLLPGRGLRVALKGGFLLGAVHVLLQLHLAPAASMAILFALVLVLVLIRGTSRIAQEVR